MIRNRASSSPAWTVLAVLGLVAGTAAAPAFAQAAEPSSLTYVAEWTIARDQWQGYADWVTRNHRPILERLAADGTLLDWGIYETYVHTDDGNTHGVWFSAANFAGIEKTRAELIKAPSHPAAAAGAHHDFLVRPLLEGHGSGTVSGGFLSVNMQTVVAGKGEAWKAMWEKNSKPVLDKLVADGHLARYSVDVEDVHTAPNTVRFVVMVSKSAEAEDRIGEAFDAARAKRSEAEREELRRQTAELTDGPAHRDYLAKVTAAWFK